MSSTTTTTENSQLKRGLVAIERQQALPSSSLRMKDTSTSAARWREAAARISLIHMTPRKWVLVQIFEALVGFLKLLVPLPRPVENPSEPPARILVVEYWKLGDLAILVPFLRSLQKSFPRAQISLLGNPDLAHFFEGQGLADEFISVRVPWARHFNRWRKYNPFSLDWISLARTILALRKRRFDWAFTGRMDVRDNLLLWLSGAHRRIGYGFGGGASFLTDRVTPDLSRPHRADVWLHLLRALNASRDYEAGGYRLTDTDLTLARSLLAGLGVPSTALLIGLHAGARIATRRWGDQRFAEIARRVLEDNNAHVLWFSEPGNSLEAPTIERCHVVSLDFRAFLAVLSLCRLFVCNDSGPMHLANLLNVPVVAVFGPTRPEWFGPRGQQDRVVIRQEFSCRPCFDYCIFDQPYCLRTISIEEVHGAIQSALRPIHEPTLERATVH